jgi:hypothetical protein
MKKIPLALSLVLVSSACHESEPVSPPKPPSPPPIPAASAQPTSTDLLGFEGEVGLLVRSNEAKEAIPPVLVQVKGAKLRFDLPAGVMDQSPIAKNAYVVAQPDDKRLFFVLPTRKQVVKIELEKLADELENLSPAKAAAQAKPAPEALLQVTKTGTIAEVAGRRCEEWELVPQQGNKMRLCVANDSNAWFQLPTIGLPTEHAWARQLFDGKHLPLRVVSYAPTGSEEGRLEVTKLEKKPVADSVFELPAGYETVDLAAMIGSMMASALPAGVKLPPELAGPDGKMPPHVREMMRKMAERASAAKAKKKQPAP